MRSRVCIGLIILTTAIVSCSSGGSGGGGIVSFDLDATGTWKGTYTISGVGTKNFEAKAEQNNGILNGTISIPYLDITDASLTGKVTKNQIEFGNIESVIEFTGTVEEDDTATGEYTIQSGGKIYKGSWEGFCIRDMVQEKTIELPFSSSFQGLAWDGSQFWVSDGQILRGIGTDGSQKVTYMYNGSSFEYHDFNAICFDGTCLWAVEDGYGSYYNRARFCLIDLDTGEIKKEFSCPPDGLSSSIAGPIGIAPAWDGTNIFCLRLNQDGSSYSIYKLRASDGTTLSKFNAPEDPINEGGIMPGGFGFAEGFLYLVLRNCYVFKLQITDGKIVRRYKYTGDEYGSICWDGSHYWIRDLRQSKLSGFILPSGRL